MVAILRNLATNLFMIGSFEEGREYYRKALSLFDDGQFEPSNDVHEVSTHALTEMFWAQQEALVRKCDAWEEHIEKAYVHVEKAISLIPEFIGFPNPIKGQIDKTASYGCNP